MYPAQSDDRTRTAMPMRRRRDNLTAVPVHTVVADLPTQEFTAGSDSRSGVRSKTIPPQEKIMTPPNAVWVRFWHVGMWFTAALHSVTPSGRAIVYFTLGEEQLQITERWEYR